MTTDQIAITVFNAVFYPVIGWAFVSGHLQNRFPLASALSGVWNSALMRAAFVSLIGQAFAVYFDDMIDGRILSLLICGASAVAMTAIPAGGLSSLVSGVFISQVMFAIIALTSEFNYTQEIFFWRSNIIASFVLVALLAGASCGRTGQRIMDSIGGFFVGMANKARRRKLPG